MQWFETFDGLWTQSWALLDGPQVKCTLATIGISGAPETRMVVIRGTDRARGSVSMHTDNATVKMQEIARNPQAAVHVWFEPEQLQLRLRGSINVLTGKNAAPFWPAVLDMSRSNYGVDPTPGTTIPHSDAYTRVATPDRFAVLTLDIDEIDLVHLSDDYHRRALFQRSCDWHGQWLSP